MVGQGLLPERCRAGSGTGHGICAADNGLAERFGLCSGLVDKIARDDKIDDPPCGLLDV